MKKVFMLPTPTAARANSTNSINQIVLALAKHLPAFGWEVTENESEADIVAGHAGQMGKDARVDVAHLHGMYPTAHYGALPLWDSLNAKVVESLRQAREITAPSEWVADILRRDMGVNPHVIGWAIEPQEWHAGENHGYVLWNKTRADIVCDPLPLLKLAAACPDIQFHTTFGTGTPNVHTLGLLPFEEMKSQIQHASVYLATVHETFGIGTLEALACGVPVLGFRHGGTAQIVEHGVTGYLVAPNDYDGLVEGLRYCLKHRAVLSANAHAAAQKYTWEKIAQQFAAVYDKAIAPRSPVKLSVVVPVYNYARFVAQAIESVKTQQNDFSFEIIVVDDGSTDDSVAIAKEALEDFALTWHVYTKPNGGVASARNYGIEHAQGEYILCLDADDALGSPHMLQTLADALDADPSLGIAYTGLTMMTEGGVLSPNPHPFPPPFDFEQQATKHNCVPTCAMFRREAWERAGGYRKELQPAEDANLWLRITALGYGARKVTDEGMFHYRLHSNSLSSSVRSGVKREPEWNNFAWVKDNLRPFAAPPIPPRIANPVRNYDTPQVTILIEVTTDDPDVLQRALDSVESQTFRFWECLVVSKSGHISIRGAAWVKQCAFEKAIERVYAPLVAVMTSTEQLPPDFLENALKHFQRTGQDYRAGDLVLMRKTKWFNPHVPNEHFAIVHTDTLQDMLRVEILHEGFITGVVTKHHYGFKQVGDLCYLFTKDIPAMLGIVKPVAPVIGVERTATPPPPVLVEKRKKVRASNGTR